VQHWIRGSEVWVWCLFETAEGGRRNEEVTHVVRPLCVMVDVFETVGRRCHVLIGVVVAYEVDDCTLVSSCR
jgi:hypothetical protein